MALSRVNLTATGDTNVFTVKFALGYMDLKDVTCRVGNETDGAGNPIYRPITPITTELLQVGGALIPAGTSLNFERTVDIDKLRVDFVKTKLLSEENLNTAQLQALMAVHQVLDGRFDVFSQNISAGGFRITALGVPTDDADAATKKYVDDKIVSNDGNAAAAAASAAAAATSASNANSSANSASMSKNSAALSEDGANSSKVVASAAAATAEYWAGVAHDTVQRPAIGDVPGLQSALDSKAAQTALTALDNSLKTVAKTGAYNDLSGRPTLGTAAALNVGTAANNIVQRGTGGAYPAGDGSAITNTPGFRPPDMWVQDERASGTSGDAAKPTYVAATLNTVKRNIIAGASLASNQITLPAGDYYVKWRNPYLGNASSSNGGQNSKTRLRNITAGANLAIGTPTACTSGSPNILMTLDSVGAVLFTLAVTSVIELQRAGSNASSSVFGYATGFSEIEVYAAVEIWKLN